MLMIGYRLEACGVLNVADEIQSIHEAHQYF